MWKQIITVPILAGFGVGAFFFIKTFDFITSFGIGLVISIICLVAAAVGYFKGSLSQKK